MTGTVHNLANRPCKSWPVGRQWGTSQEGLCMRCGPNLTHEKSVGITLVAHMLVVPLQSLLTEHQKERGTQKYSKNSRLCQVLHTSPGQFSFQIHVPEQSKSSTTLVQWCRDTVRHSRNHCIQYTHVTEPWHGHCRYGQKLPADTNSWGAHDCNPASGGPIWVRDWTCWKSWSSLVMEEAWKSLLGKILSPWRWTPPSPGKVLVEGSRRLQFGDIRGISQSQQVALDI